MERVRAEVAVIGGGVIGASLAYGLINRNPSVLLIDKENMELTASRGNFGLVWVQGKGFGMPRYAEWSIEATEQWPDFASRLQEESGISLDYEKTGGFEICLGSNEFEQRKVFIKQMKEQSKDGTYPCEMITRSELQSKLPEIELGDEVSGASLCPHDGFVNPLALLKALLWVFQQKDGKYHPGHSVQNIQKNGSGFSIETESCFFQVDKVVIASGLGTTKLSKMVNMHVPVKPERGQVMVTERTKRVFPFATGRLRQNADGSFMLGASNEDVGYNLETSPEVLSSIASHAIRIFPILKHLQLIRSWASLRVLTPDQKPVYLESEEYPGAFAVTSHSGVSLASLHSSHLPEWILDGKTPLDFEVFHSKRFDVPKTC
ncbi:MAG: FAD-dependent oxidoreductase [SAR324 cluster bacterium]|nr:FAD-dependent oxidoreductase [SAR324 cluster bacterium]